MMAGAWGLHPVIVWLQRRHSSVWTRHWFASATETESSILMSEMRVGVWRGCYRNTLLCSQYVSVLRRHHTAIVCLFDWFGSLDRWNNNMDSSYRSVLTHDMRRILLVALKEEVSTCMKARGLVWAWLGLLKVNDGCWEGGDNTTQQQRSIPAELPVCQQKAQTHCRVRKVNIIYLFN